jgi:hypothetical protein
MLIHSNLLPNRNQILAWFVLLNISYRQMLRIIIHIPMPSVLYVTMLSWVNSAAGRVVLAASCAYLKLDLSCCLKTAAGAGQDSSRAEKPAGHGTAKLYQPVE